MESSSDGFLKMSLNSSVNSDNESFVYRLHLGLSPYGSRMGDRRCRVTPSSSEKPAFSD